MRVFCNNHNIRMIQFHCLTRQHLGMPAIIGICMILGGIVVINLFSEPVGH